ncbi:glycosyltransferase involved in cell wall biosynthesis [Flavobacterium cutihirudinis]|uniref:Glycosyltransferase involved in cell wall biosynthesis n=1 Tax=Flavobacterium cutihirudinis TaxID=1265740 RepID=A0A3D9FK93_9FLAO|nr:glycosyltransferase family 4 protein [Flavobacterium cutihirudinis]RED19600.1 glycosyltransferase involved in cell wall biosynthesis [Flavobacterium cutihirudinis]
MKVLFLSKYNRDGASSRYRFYNYKPYFDKNHIEYNFKPLLDDKYVLNLYSNNKKSVIVQRFLSVLKRFYFLMFQYSKCDLIVIEKELFPNVPFIVEKFLLRGKSYALDFDDYIATGYKLNPVKRFFFRNKIDKLANGAKFVTVGNHWYFSEIKSDNLVYLPTVINLEKYPKKKLEYKTDIITIVWIGSLSTGKYLQIVAPTLQKLSQKYPIKLKVIGVDIAIEGIDVELVNWKEATEVEELLSSDIGIMPLEDTMWENGKCGFKLVQYMACGLPVIASAAPANKEIIDEGINGFIINNQDDWYDAFEKLILNVSLREQFGKSGRQKIENKYSYQVWGDRYSDFLEQKNKK